MFDMLLFSVISVSDTVNVVAPLVNDSELPKQSITPKSYDKFPVILAVVTNTRKGTPPVGVQSDR